MTHRYLRINLSFLLVLAVFFILAAPFAHAGLCVERCYFFNNPLTSGDLGELIKSVYAQLQPAAIMFLVLAIIYVAFRYIWAVTTGGSLVEIKKLTWKLFWGAIIITGGNVILQAVIKFANQIK